MHARCSSSPKEDLAYSHCSVGARGAGRAHLGSVHTLVCTSGVHACTMQHAHRPAPLMLLCLSCRAVSTQCREGQTSRTPPACLHAQHHQPRMILNVVQLQPSSRRSMQIQLVGSKRSQKPEAPAPRSSRWQQGAELGRQPSQTWPLVKRRAWRWTALQRSRAAPACCL